MKSYNVDVGRFIRNAIAEKIEREYKEMKPPEVEDDFSNRLKKAICLSL